MKRFLLKRSGFSPGRARAVWTLWLVVVLFLMGACGDDAPDDAVVVPDACADGTFDHADDASTACVAWTECEPGSYVADEPSATSDRVCAACGDGTFSAEENAAS